MVSYGMVWYVCMYLCIYVCIYMHMYVYVCRHTYVSLSLYNIHMYTYLYVMKLLPQVLCDPRSSPAVGADLSRKTGGRSAEARTSAAKMMVNDG